MHNGPALAYLAPNPGPDTSANDLKFFKIFESGFIPSAGKISGTSGGLQVIDMAIRSMG